MTMAGDFSCEAFRTLVVEGADLEAPNSEGQTVWFLRAQLPLMKEVAANFTILLQAA